MDFAISIDDEAKSVAPGTTDGRSKVELTDALFCLQFGRLLRVRVDRQAISGASMLPDPRPTVYLPPGVSSAVEQFGAEVLCAVGSHDGLVRIDFNRSVQGETRPANVTLTERPEAPESSVEFQHLIVSLEDPDGFITAVGAH